MRCSAARYGMPLVAPHARRSTQALSEVAALAGDPIEFVLGSY
jgi:hypothetical protein